MPSLGQLTGMRGVFLVAAELCRVGLIASPTSRSAIGADILATDLDCSFSYSVQVKTNSKTYGFWLLSPKAKVIKSPTHIYVFVNVKDDRPQFFVVPSEVVVEKMKSSTAKTGHRGEWRQIDRKDIIEYENNWSCFETCSSTDHSRNAPNPQLKKLAKLFHALIIERAAEFTKDARLKKLPSLKSDGTKEQWFAVPGMYGGFKYQLQGEGEGITLMVESWSRVIDGSEKRHRITTKGIEVLDQAAFRACQRTGSADFGNCACT